MTASGDALPQERQQMILHRLAAEGRVVATELATEFGVSEDSIRRDLRELAARGLCRRVYGGALPPTPDFPPLARRHHEHAAGKRALAVAAVAAARIRPGQLLLLDAGSTNSAIAAALPERQALTVATNAPDIAQTLMAREGFEVLLIGGRIDPSSGAALGAQAMAQLRDLRADLCFPGACAIDADHGLWSVDGEQAPFKRLMIEASGEAVVVATNAKLGTQAAHRVAALEAIATLVVEHDAPPAQRARFAARGIAVHVAAPP